MRRFALLLPLLIGCEHAPATPPPPPPMLSEAQLAEAKKEIAARRAAADEEDRLRREAVVAARKKKLEPGKCPVSARDLLGEYDLDSSMRSGLILRALGVTDLLLDGKPDKSDGPAHKGVAAVVGPLELRMGGALHETPERFLAQLRAAQPPAYALTLVVDELQEPKMVGESQFTGGTVRGRLYLWSHEKRANVCAAPLDGESSETVTVRGSLGIPASAAADGRLWGDLLVPAIARAAERLQVLEK